MKKILIGVGMVLTLTGCMGSEKDYNIYTTNSLQGSEKAAKFIVDCAKAANPLSDEEGEDLVAQCESTALRLFGETRYYAAKESYYSRRCITPTYEETLECMKIEGLEGK